MTDLKSLRKLAEEATSGPWEVSVGNGGSIFGDLNTDHNGDNPYIGEVHGVSVKSGLNGNAKFIAAANPSTVLSLIDEIEFFKERLRFIKEHMEIVINKPEMSTVWLIADKALSDSKRRVR